MALPEESRRWEKKAEAVGRTRSAWTRRRMLEADARDEELAVHVSESRDGDAQ